MKKLFIYLVFFISALSSFGQTDNYGTDFWTGFMSGYTSGSELKLFVSAKQNSTVTISVPLLAYSKTFSVLKDSVVLFTVPNSVGQITTSEIVEKTGIHIVSDFPIAITAMNLERATTDATIVYPLKNIPISPVYITGHPKANINEFLLVSPENGVKVEIVPTKNTTKSTAFVPIKITLDQGETYQVQSSNTLDGSTIRVTNNKKIIVFTGDKCSNFPCGACDHQYEQVIPNQLLDTAYYVLPHFGHKKGYTVKVVSIDTTIWVKVNGKPYRIGKKDSALVLDVPSGDSVLHISGPRKFACFQFMKGPTCNGYITSGWGDPSILEVMSARYMGQKSTFCAVNSTNLKDHFVSILIYTSAKNTAYLDGTKISSSEFFTVTDNPDFSYAMLKISLGVHTITCNLGHLAYCYGIGNYESYLYTAGFSLPDFDISIRDTALKYDCKNNKVTMRFEAVLEGAIKEYHWDFGDGSATDTSKIVTHKYTIGKDFTVKLWALGYNNKKDSLIKKYNFKWPEFNPVFDKVLCDKSYTFEEKNPFFKNFKWHDNTTSNTYTTSKTEKIWVTATDTSGYCKFGDTAQISKIDVFSKIVVDTLSNCQLNNLFKFTDSSGVKNDLIRYKVWMFPGGVTRYDTSKFYYHFRQPGKVMVYLDIYPANSECKARIEIPVTINWNTDIDAIVDKEKYCNGEVATVIDKSYSCCQPVKKYYWEFANGTKLKSDSGKFSTKVYYDYKNSNGMLNFNYITETYQGCRDTIKSGVIVWPAAKSKFDFGSDSVKCLALSRWTFTHTYDESIAGPYTLFWNFGNGKTGTQNQYKNVRYFDTGIYKITLTTTSNIGCVDSVSKYVKAVGNAVAKFSINDTIQCLATNRFIVTDSSKGYDIKYVWNFGNGSTSILQKPAAEHYKVAGKYKIKLKAISNYAGCFADSVTHNVFVMKQPTADFSINNTTVCFKNNSVIFTDNSKFYNGKYKLYWNYNSNLDSAFAPTAVHFSDTGNYAIRLIAKDSMGCLDTISKTVTLKPEPLLKMTINDSIQCFGINNFSVQSLNPDKLKNRIWTLNNVLINGGEIQKNIINLTPKGFYKVTLAEETTFGCKDSLSKIIEVLPAIKAGFSINNDTQCNSSQSFDFINTSNLGKDILKSLKFEENIKLIGAANSILNYKFLSTGNKIIELKIETVQGCKDSIKKMVFVATDPLVTFISDSVCLGKSVTLNANQTTGAPLSQWAWNMGDGSRFDPVIVNYTTHTYQAAGIYYPEVSFTDQLGCYGIYKGVPIVIYPIPNPNFNISTLYSDDLYSFVKLIPNTLGHASYLWSFPDKTTNTTDTPTVKFSKFFKDRISLKVVSAFGCSDTASHYFYIFPSLTNLYRENAFTPNGDLLNDVFKPYNIDGAKDYELRIFDRWGELLFNTNDPNAGWNGTYKNELVQVGVYIFEVRFMYADGNRYSTKGSVTVVR